MVRSLGRTLFAAVLVAVGCRDMSMDLFPPPPPAGAGTGAESGTGDDMPPGDGGGSAGRGGTGGAGGANASGASGSAGTGGINFGGSAGCTAGSNCPPSCQPGTPGCPCVTHSDCSKVGLQFCSFGRCVQCLPANDCDSTSCGCDKNQTCADGLNYCVPRCDNDSDCKTDERPYCDYVRNLCIECKGDDDCHDPNRRHCYENWGFCVECVTSNNCDDENKPVCSYDLTCQRCWTDSDCGSGRFCRDGRCFVRTPTQQTPPPEP